MNLVLFQFFQQDSGLAIHFVQQTGELFPIGVKPHGKHRDFSG